MEAAITQLDVGAALLRSRARLRRAAALPAGVWVAHWGNADTQTAYLKPSHHTLSFYLEGGHAVRCHQAPSARGEPGSLCLLPAGHESHWDVNGSLQLLHVYLPTLQWAQAAERWFELDPRSATLAERIYFHDEGLASLCGRIAALDWRGTGEALLLQQLTLDLQARLLMSQTVHRPRLGPVRGGLSPAARRRVLEKMETHLHERLDLAELARVACLSEFHFARMFKTSFGTSPHAWVMQRRLERARRLLAQGHATLDEVVQRCGYAHLSHLNAALKRAGLPSASAVRQMASAVTFFTSSITA
ncbi:AraC family transcriptional regulator [Piscinibacter sp. XHJ-5]|uniref:AraC family transcriptional regulator n=1 Tax=Piscinibacter sp. XHJ-5 TaxID=3037797 RepID=UPI002452ECC6|nr:AraC family transcriptional regulator [Piscinibacter sp. XHJ-5]